MFLSVNLYLHQQPGQQSYSAQEISDFHTLAHHSYVNLHVKQRSGLGDMLIEPFPAKRCHFGFKGGSELCKLKLSFRAVASVEVDVFSY